jgi:hypothetical protein
MQIKTGIRNRTSVHSEYFNYLEKHQAEPFVMLDEMNLNYEQFENLFNNSYPFRHMWTLECDLSYYEIRAGKCEFAKVYHGKIHCTNKNCK